MAIRLQDDSNKYFHTHLQDVNEEKGECGSILEGSDSDIIDEDTI